MPKTPIFVNFGRQKIKLSIPHGSVPGHVAGHVSHCSSNLSYTDKGHGRVSRPSVAMLVQGLHGEMTWTCV